MDVAAWAQGNIGRTVLIPQDPAGIPGQCVNVGSSWLLYNGGRLPVAPTAIAVWNGNPPAGWQKIATTAVQPGDVVFYYANDSNAAVGTGPAGHVDVCVNLIAGGYRGIDADWANNASAEYYNHSSAGIAGVFRKVTAGVPQGDDEIMNADVVTSMFRMGFRRDPTTAELGFWNGKTVGQLLNAEMTNAEWLQGAGPAGVSQMVLDSLVRGILGHNPTPDDDNRYVGQSLDFVLSDLISRKG